MSCLQNTKNCNIMGLIMHLLHHQHWIDPIMASFWVGSPLMKRMEWLQSLLFTTKASKEKNLPSCAVCGAVLCTPQRLNHRTVHHEFEPTELHNAAANEDIYSQVLVEYREDSHDYLKILNNASSQWLHEKVYNFKALKAQANVQPNTS